MERPEFERQPREITPIRRYYNYLRRDQGGYASYAIAAERLLDDEGLGEAGRTYDQLYGTVIPTAEQFEQNQKAAINMLTLMPMELIAPWVDMTFELEDVKNWYDETALQIKAATKTHPKSCYALLESGADLRCKESDVCPCRMLSRVLLLPAMEPDFDDLDYLVDPKRSLKIALYKLYVAFERKLLPESQYDEAEKKYIVEYENRFKGLNELGQNRH